MATKYKDNPVKITSTGTDEFQVDLSPLVNQVGTREVTVVAKSGDWTINTLRTIQSSTSATLDEGKSKVISIPKNGIVSLKASGSEKEIQFWV